MGFSGGGSNILKPHTHDSTILQDGGNLDFDNITQANLTAGDLTFSDGVHLQRLAIGSAAQSLIVSGASLPAWGSSSTSILAATGDMLYASAANTLANLNIGNAGQVLAVNAAGTLPEWSSSGRLQLLEHYEESAATNNAKTFTFSPSLDMTDNYAQVILLSSMFGLSGDLYATINAQVGTVYNLGANTSNAGTAGTFNDSAVTALNIQRMGGAGDTRQGELNILGNSADGRLNGFYKEYSSLTKSAVGGFYMGIDQSGVISSIELTTSAGNWNQGSTFDVYGYKI
jgi:hypothetical protein